MVSTSGRVPAPAALLKVRRAGGDDCEIRMMPTAAAILTSPLNPPHSTRIVNIVIEACDGNNLPFQPFLFGSQLSEISRSGM
jgi:hypothetical protein